MSVSLDTRVDERIVAWRIEIERVVETDRSVIVFGRRNGLPVVLKVVAEDDDERRAGEILRAFDGRGMVRVHEHVDGAVLLERLDPGHSLARLTLRGEDEEASRILARTIQAMSPCMPAFAVPTVRDWGRAFERYAVSGDAQIPVELVAAAQSTYRELCETQGTARLLHGDLHHDNVLFDRERGWLAIDPKGVVGELEFELGAALRNPQARPDLFADRAIVRRRVERLVDELSCDRQRVLSWAFAQAVLSAIWSVEDRDRVESSSGALALARVLQREIGE